MNIPRKFVVLIQTHEINTSPFDSSWIFTALDKF